MRARPVVKKRHLHNRLELHAVDPRRRRRVLLAEISLVAVAAVAAALLTEHWLILDYRTKLSELHQIRERAAVQARKIDDLQHQLAIAQRAAQIDDVAAVALKQRMRQLEQHVDDANSQLEFFRELTKSGAQRKGLNVYDFSLKSTLSPGIYRYRITLAQNLERAKSVSGRVDMVVEAQRDGAMVSLPFAELAAPGQSKLSYDFKYFEQLSGEIHIPDSVKPQRILLHVRPKARRAARINESFDWNAVLDAG